MQDTPPNVITHAFPSRAFIDQAVDGLMQLAMRRGRVLAFAPVEPPHAEVQRRHAPARPQCPDFRPAA